MAEDKQERKSTKKSKSQRATKRSRSAGLSNRARHSRKKNVADEKTHPTSPRRQSVKTTAKPKPVLDVNTVLIILAAAVIIFTQFQISSINSALESSPKKNTVFGGDNLKNVDVSQIKSTAQGIATLFAVDKIKTAQDAINAMIPTGTPEYGEEIGGISYDDPVAALNYLARQLYPRIKQDVKQNDPDAWQRYLNLAAQPRGIACEFCCGVGPQGVDQNGNLRCGCQHNPAAQAIALWLVKNTDYSDAEVLREVYRWKSLWFPKNMVGLALKIAGGDESVLKDVPGMVGGC